MKALVPSVARMVRSGSVFVLARGGLVIQSSRSAVGAALLLVSKGILRMVLVSIFFGFGVMDDG